MRSDDKELMVRGIKALDLDLDRDQVDLLERYVDEIEKWNPSYGLVKAQGPELVIKHILDCLSAAPYIKSIQGPIADLGSGAGLPGIVLAIALKDRDVYLIERMQRRVGFLRNAVAVTGLTPRVRIIDSDIKDLKMSFGIITFRAFHHFNDIQSSIMKISGPGSVIFAYKGDPKALGQELEECNLQSFDYSVQNLTVPFLEGKRCLLTLKRK